MRSRLPAPEAQRKAESLDRLEGSSFSMPDSTIFSSSLRPTSNFALRTIGGMACSDGRHIPDVLNLFNGRMHVCSPC